MVIDAETHTIDTSANDTATGVVWAARIGGMLGCVLAAALAAACTSSFIWASLLWLLFWFLFGLLNILVLGYVTITHSEWFTRFGAWLNSKF